MQCLFAHMPLTSTLQPATVSVKSCSQFQSNANCVYFNLTMLGEKKAGVGTVRHTSTSLVSSQAGLIEMVCM